MMRLLRNGQDAGAKQMTIDVWQVGHLAVIDISGPRDRIFLPLPLPFSHIGMAFYARPSKPCRNEECAFRLQLPAVILQS